MLRLYNDPDSGNSYKVNLLLTQLGIDFERIDVDLLGGETRTERFRARNPLGQVPFIEMEDGRVLAESNAILWFLAQDSTFLPQDRWTRAQVLQWMNFEQYRIEPNIGSLRFWITMLGIGDQRATEIERRREAGNLALTILDRHLARRSFAAGEFYTIADIALYGYSHLAEEAGYRLDQYSAVTAWFDRIRAQPRHVPITAEVGRVIPWPESRAS
ncbi:MAG TPA: glutathione S-transferase family protein [Stellaceae bacterium]|nr:glutathione S-transferase family protein [Stellaceae bacterium]